MHGPGCLCALGQLLLPPHRLHLHDRDTQSGQQSPEMLQARLSPPFISPVSLGTASGEGGSRNGGVQTAQEKTCSHRESEGDLPTQLQMLVSEKQPAPAWFLAIFTLCSPHHSGLSSHIPWSCVTLSFTHSLQLVTRALEQQSQDALLTSIFTMLCKDSYW